jgi:NPCBM/NEW2 domain
MSTKVKAEFSEWKMDSQADGLHVSAKVSANLPLTAIIAYADPEGGGDYNSEIASGIPQANGSFSLLLPHPENRRNTNASLHFVAVAANGSATASVWSEQALSFPARVDAAGRLDVSQVLATLELEKAWLLKKAGHLDATAKAALSPMIRDHFERLDRADSAAGKSSPAQAAVEVKKLALSDAAPESAQTGWGGVHYDRTHDGAPLISSSGPARHGLYAHANAEHSYELGGTWTSLSGRVGILKGGYGKVRFSLWADGKEIWKSKMVDAESDKSFSVKVAGVQKLILKADAEDKGGAWSAWLEPELSR